MKNFADLTEREVLAVAISSEEEDSRIYMSFAEDLAERYPDSAKLFEEMAEGGKGHRHMLLEMYEQRFGSKPSAHSQRQRPGILRRLPDLADPDLSLDTIRKEDGTIEFRSRKRFCVKRAGHLTCDVGVRRLLGDPAEAGARHEKTAAKLTDQILSPTCAPKRKTPAGGVFVLQYVFSRGWPD